MNEMMIELLINETKNTPTQNNSETFSQTFSSLLTTQILIRDEHITRSKKAIYLLQELCRDILSQKYDPKLNIKLKKYLVALNKMEYCNHAIIEKDLRQAEEMLLKENLMPFSALHAIELYFHFNHSRFESVRTLSEALMTVLSTAYIRSKGEDN